MSKENQVKLMPHEHIQMLGVPLGDGAFVSKFVEGKLLGRLQETVNRLVEFEDTQADDLSVTRKLQHSSCSAFHAHHST